MKRNVSDSLITEALEIEQKEAKEAGTIGYTARSLIQATLPHSKVDDDFFERINGNFKLSMSAKKGIGLPYGTIPRLLLAWIATEATKKKSPHLILGDTLTSFMKEIGLIPSGGNFGTIKALKNQIQRLFTCSISCIYDDGKKWAIQNVQAISKAGLWWDAEKIVTTDICKSSVILNYDFFNEIINNPVPIDMRVLKLLKRSPLALDTYCWLTYRLSYLKRSTIIPWKVLLNQFGCGYPDDPRGRRNFKSAFLGELKKVSLVYPQANIEPLEKGLLLNPSNTHISRLSPKG